MLLRGLDPAVRKRILQDNAAELYKLQVPASLGPSLALGP